MQSYFSPFRLSDTLFERGRTNMWIDNASQVDILFYEPYADVISEIAQNPEYKPLTIGVFGIWGAGKSTLLNLIEQKIRVDGTDHKNICIKINAWAFEGYEDAKVAVIECLLRELKEKAPAGLGKKILNLLKRVDFFKLTTKAIGVGAPIIAGIATGNPLPVMLGITGTASEIGNSIKEASDAVQTLHDDYLKEDKSPSEESLVNNIRKFRDEFERALNESDIENVIVLIDDMDRCQPDRIIETLEAIKLFLSVNKTVFVIAADENVIQYAIKRKYPPLEGFSVNLDREYIEKIVQLPIYIPELSSKDIENYLMLLVAQEYCTAEDFEKLISDLRNADVRISEDEIDLAKLHKIVTPYITEEQVPAFNETALIISGIKGIIGNNLKGNPRQAKRFLNTFTTKRKLAELYYGKDEIDLAVLAKLLVLQKMNPDLFIELNEWNKRFSTINDEFLQMREALSREGEAGKADDRFKAWRVPNIKSWVFSEPVELEKKRLDRYFYLTRESLRKAEIDVSSLSLAAKNVLTRIGNCTPGTIQTITEEIKALSALDQEDVFNVFLPKLAQGKAELYIAAEFFVVIEGYREQIVSALRSYSGAIGMSAVPQIKKMRSADQPRVDDLISLWKSSGKISDGIIKRITAERI